MPNNGFLDLNGTPVLLATGTNGMTVGCNGAGTFRIFLGSGTMQIPISNPAEGVAATTIANSATIAVTNYWQRVTNAGAVTGIIIAAGTVHGQKVLVSVDKDAVGTVTMAAAGTSRVGTGVGCVLAIGAAREFIWDNTDLIWCECGET
jgi:hypothetical protein